MFLTMYRSKTYTSLVVILCILSISMQFTDGYQRAKLRMVSARENLREDFVQTLKATQFGDTDA